MSGTGPRDESHRIYFQRYQPQQVVQSSHSTTSNNNSTATSSSLPSKRNRVTITTTSVAIRLTEGTTAEDVTTLMRKKLGFSSGGNNGNPGTGKKGDALILVGTLTGLPPGYIRYEHQKDTEDEKGSESACSEPMSVVRTLSRHEHPLAVRDQMSAHLFMLQQDAHGGAFSDAKLQRIEHVLHMQRSRGKAAAAHTSAMTMRWYFLPFHAAANTSEHELDFIHSQQEDELALPSAWTAVPVAYSNTSLTPPFLHLDGYSTDMDTSSSSSEDNAPDGSHSPQHHRRYASPDRTASPSSAPHDVIHFWNQEDYGYSCLLEPSFQQRSDHSPSASPSSSPRHHTPLSHTPTAIKPQHHRHISDLYYEPLPPRILKELRYRDMFLNATEQNKQCLSGFLYKRSQTDDNVWRKVHCVLTDRELWYITRVKHGFHTKSTKNHHRHFHPTKRPLAKYRYIRLSNALVSKATHGSPTSSIPHLVEVCSARGNIHSFRASTKKAQLYWIASIASQIVLCHEDNFMDLAELIIEEQENVRCV